jgi:hypothetical protein
MRAMMYGSLNSRDGAVMRCPVMYHDGT